MVIHTNGTVPWTMPTSASDIRHADVTPAARQSPHHQRGQRQRDQRARRLSDEEGQTLLRIVRRGEQDTVRYRRALIIMASASGTPVPAIARL
jgi:hypothetical protein